MSEKEKLEEQEVENREEELEETLSPEEECRKELDEALAAKAEAEEKVLRIHADFENSKKRIEKDKANAVAFANESFATDLLSVLDSFDSAFASLDQIEAEDAAEAIGKIKEGMELTYNQMISVLKKHGVEEVAGEGEFDPEVHQAIMQVESDEHDTGHVVQVMQKGYKMKDRTIRAAMVSTAK